MKNIQKVCYILMISPPIHFITETVNHQLNILCSLLIHTHHFPAVSPSIIGSSGAGCSRMKSSAACFSTALGVVPCAAHAARNFAA